MNIADTEIQLPNKELGIGHMTWAFISQKEDSIDPSVKGNQYYQAVTSTMINKFSFSDRVLNDLAILLPKSQANYLQLIFVWLDGSSQQLEEINNIEEQAKKKKR